MTNQRIARSGVNDLSLTSRSSPAELITGEVAPCMPAQGKEPYPRSPGEIETAVVRLDLWLDSMRGSGGYGGPVSHWWQQCLMYCGAGLDWRYEGIITGYLNLWERTGDYSWLRKAVRAGEDLVAGQRDDGHFRNSGFELNPTPGGTPHEAACDAALLLLATKLRAAGDDRWKTFLGSARLNLESFYVQKLWDPDARAFGDSTTTVAFVPNKAATACEAMFRLSELSGDSLWIEQHALPTLDRIVEHQVRDRSSLDGAIAQNSLSGTLIEKYFPIYIARCVNGLLNGYRWSGREIYLDSAVRAMQFVARWTATDGSLPTVVYGNRRVSSHPSWIAPLGDVLRAADELAPHRYAADFGATLDRVLSGQDESGGIQTARGFAGQATGRSPDVPDFRDLLHVAGWCDKVFRYLTAHVETPLPQAVEISRFATECTFLGQRMHFVETAESIELTTGSELRYRWIKGQDWPEIAGKEFWLR